jgi:hypothetical protein
VIYFIMQKRAKKKKVKRSQRRKCKDGVRNLAEKLLPGKPAAPTDRIDAIITQPPVLDPGKKEDP